MPIILPFTMFGVQVCGLAAGGLAGVVELDASAGFGAADGGIFDGGAAVICGVFGAATGDG